MTTKWLIVLEPDGNRLGSFPAINKVRELVKRFARLAHDYATSEVWVTHRECTSAELKEAKRVDQILAHHSVRVEGDDR